MIHENTLVSLTCSLVSLICSLVSLTCSLVSLTYSEEDVLLLACANKGYQVVFIHNIYPIVLLCVNTRDTRL